MRGRFTSGRVVPASSWLRRSRVTVASWTVLSLLAGGLVAYAVTSDGFPTHRADLDDGGVWVVNRDFGATGRQNVPIGQLDGMFFGGRDFERSAEIDVLQNASAVVSYDGSDRTLMPVDVSMTAGLDDQRVQIAGTPALGGGSLAVIDPQDGRLWASRFQPTEGPPLVSDLSADAEPLVTVGPQAAATVTTAGTVLAVSAAESTLLSLNPTEAGFDDPSEQELEGRPTGKVTALSAVGESPAWIDESGVVGVEGGGSATLGKGAQLQQPGPAAEQLVAATPAGLVAVDLDEADVTELAAAQGEPTEPVRLGSCTFGAWAAGATATVTSVCDGASPVTSEIDLKPAAELVFRVNRNRVVLNDVENGDVWRLDGSRAEKIADWESFEPREQDKQNDDDNQTAAKLSDPPQAEDDDLGVRPGRTTVLHVLDNDKAPPDAILSVVDLEGADDLDGVTVRVAPDNQSLLATVAAGAAGGPRSFGYVVNDGRGSKDGQDTGQVALRVEDGSDVAPPELRPGFERIGAPTFSVAAEGSVDISVLPDWRDPEYGDPVLLEDADVTVGEVTLTPEGLLKYDAPLRAVGPQRIEYTVSTGGAASTKETVTVDVVGPRETASPQPQDDVTSGEVGAPLTVRPLDNDIPGADGIDPDARLALAGRVAPKGVQVATDLSSGIVTVTPTRPGTFFLDYRVVQGSAPPQAAQIRIDALPPAEEDGRPIAAPDTAAVHGMSPAVVDVLVNDYDPRGRMLVVQDAAPSDPDAPVEVAVVDGRWLRVTATDADGAGTTEDVTYTLSNGEQQTTGSLTVTRRAPLSGLRNAPVTETDSVDVRVADLVSVPVLDNDSTPSGDPMNLVVDPSKDLEAGELKVLPDIGSAYVSGRRVRYVAPARVSGPTDVEVQYVVENAADPNAPLSVGTVKVHLTPEPTRRTPNQAPTPTELEGRVTHGDTLTLRLPPVGSDPDGDSVSVTGVGSAPQLGRVVAWGANSLVYQAFPGLSGTDEFSYEVSDRYGGTATGSVRIGVVGPGDPQAPVAVNDVVVADTGREIDVDVLANDLRTPGTRLEVEPLRSTAGGAELVSSRGPLRLKASATEGDALQVPYVATNGLDSSTGVLTVTSRKGFNNPPVAADVYADPEFDSATATVDVLAEVQDIDGPESELRIDEVDRAGAEIDGGTVTVAVEDTAQVLDYRVVDADGGVSVGAIYVPARPQDTPYLALGAALRLDPGETRQVDLSELVVDPEGDELFLTTDDLIAAAPQDLLEVAAVPGEPRTLQVTAGDRPGPGAVSFEISDRPELADDAAHTSLLTVPVQVGDPTPVVNCPGVPIEIAQGGQPRRIDVAALCHVFTAIPGDAETLTFEGSWEEDPGGVGLENTEDGIVLEAGADSRTTEPGVLAVGVAGEEPTGTLLVRVVPLPPPTLPVISLDAEAGEEVTLDFAEDYLASGVSDSDRDVVVMAAEQTGGTSAVVDPEESRLTITPDAGTVGEMRFRVEVSDVGDGRTDRPRAIGLVQLSVRAAPEAPRALVSGSEMLSNTVALSWQPGESNGARIDQYEVRYDGGTEGTTTCAGPPCRITELNNGELHTFEVRAHNAVGWSDWSATAKGFPDAITGPVRGLEVMEQRDRRVTLGWQAPADCDCSDVVEYVVSWPGGSQRLGATRTDTVVNGLSNGDLTTFQVRAYNEKGKAENVATAASVEGMSSGAPQAPGAPTFTATNRSGNSVKAVRISWNPVAANGGDPVEYLVKRSGGNGGSATICQWQQATTCGDDLDNTGKTYSYTVEARNAQELEDEGFHASRPSAPGTVEAAYTPDGVTGVSAEDKPDEDGGSAVVTFAVGASNGSQNRVEWTAGAQRGEWSFPTSGSGGTVSRQIDNLVDGEETTISLRSCNGSRTRSSMTGDECSAVASDTTVTYGAIRDVAVTATSASTSREVQVNVRWNGDGKAATAELFREGTSAPLQSWEGVVGDVNYTDPVGFNTTARYRLRVSDPGRDTKEATSSQVRTGTPQPTVRISKGNPGRTSYCNTASCARISVDVRGMEPSTNYRIYYSTDCGTTNRAQCLDGASEAERYNSEVIRTNPAGNIEGGGTRYFGYPGATVWLELQAYGRFYESENRVTW